MSAVVAAALDIGTNSSRLLVRGPEGDLERRTTTTRLGRGVDELRRLDADAVGRTLAVLAEYRSLLDARGATRVRAVATSAVRDALDGDEFRTRAAQVLGVEVELLSGAAEGGLSFAGAVAALPAGTDPDERVVVLDIGGGSTEVVVGTPADGVTGVLSLDTGAVRLTEQHLHHDPPAAEELSNAIDVVGSHLEDVLRELPEVRGARLVGVGGTITTVAAVELGLQVYDRAAVHGLWVPRSAVEDVFRTLATEPLRDRVHNPGLQRERADIIVGGCCVLAATLRKLELDGLLVSEADLLDAMADELLAAG